MPKSSHVVTREAGLLAVTDIREALQEMYTPLKSGYLALELRYFVSAHGRH
jgi:hypothetical protein